MRIAHRGLPRRARENTLPSFEAALAAGAQGIELDVHASADGVIVVHHDPDLAGAAIRDTRWSRLRETELAPGVRAPTLDEVCELVVGRAELFVEIKGAAMEAMVLDVLGRHAGSFAIHSFDHALIGRLAMLAAPYRLGLLLEASVPDPVALMRSHGASDLWPEQELVTERMVAAVHSAGGRVISWTVNSNATARRLASWGVDGLCTDDVAMLDGPHGGEGDPPNGRLA